MQNSYPLLSFRSSLPAKLTLVAAMFVLAVATVRMLSVDRLSHTDSVSEEVRNRWLESVRALGNLSRHTAVVRTEEAEVLFRADQPGTTASKDVRQYLARVRQDIDRYRSLPHDSDETLAFNGFLTEWTEHSGHAQEIDSLARNGQTVEAAALFGGTARSSYERASSAIRHLTDVTDTKADSARRIAADTMVRAQRFVSDLILATLALFVALSVYVWRSFSGPLLDLAGLMRRLATHDTNISIPFEGRRDEIGEMARSLAVFRRNTVELLESRKRLSMQADVLAGALEKERTLATEQRNFITTMSHEFRTPLTCIDGNAQRLIATHDRTTPAQIVDRAHRIRAAVFQMANLVGSLTGTMEMTRRPGQLRARPFDLSAMLHDLARYYREIGVGGTLEDNIGSLPEEITGDPELLHFAFSNLISNAFKYSPDGGIVTLTARAKDGSVEVTVEDRGIGIPPGEIDRVREKFYRGSNVGSIPGTGLGLHLVDEIVRQHGGCLRIDSEIGQGTRMTVSLPIESTDRSPTEGALEQDPVCRRRQGDGEPSRGGSERARLQR